MERKNREIFPKRSGPLDLDSRSDFCFVAQSFQKEQSIGALLRCADAGMAREVIIVGRKGLKKKGAVGSTSCVPYRHIHNPRDVIDYLRSSGMSIVAIEKNDRSISLFDCVYPPKPAFVFGDEIYGVCRDFLEAADLVVEIPMYGMIQSLNVAVTGAVVMYDYLQKRSREVQIKAGDQLTEKKNEETFPKRRGLLAPSPSLHSGSRAGLNSRSDFCFVAQSFQKQYNIDTLLRCADAGMAKEIIAVCRRDWDGKGIVDDTCCVPYRRIYHPYDASVYLKSNGMSIVAIEKNERSISMFDCVYPLRPAFVLGNEVYGIYPDFLEAADLVVEIPMYGVIQSLNVSVAGAVIMYDYLQKRLISEE
ncbi:RNA methyltransferase [Candidatus Poribacteria bacterium]|nr:RNA methyltransferase [Candidatus Poribacteria bacterium]